jgi:protein tyrosine phosphatase
VKFGGQSAALSVRSVIASMLQVSRAGGPSRSVTHLFAPRAWPSGVEHPDHATLVVMALEVVARSDTSSAPVVVHCDSGIGRTAVFIGLCLGIQALQTTGECHTLQIIRHMRVGRNGMVVTYDECQLLHTLLARYAADAAPPAHTTQESHL